MLFIDIGNSFTKGACYENGAWQERFRLPTPKDDKGWSDFTIPQAAHPHWWISNVAGLPAQRRWHQLAQDHCATAHFLQPQAQQFGLINRYAPPQSLGADRYAALLGALAQDWQAGEFLIIANFGTALTLDALHINARQQAQYLGGTISAGADLQCRILHQATAQLPSMDHQEVGTDIPQNTAAAMAQGAWQSVLGALLIAINRWGSAPQQIILTGGAAAKAFQLAQSLRLPAMTKAHWQMQPTLIWMGLHYWYQCEKGLSLNPPRGCSS